MGLWNFFSTLSSNNNKDDGKVDNNEEDGQGACWV